MTVTAAERTEQTDVVDAKQKRKLPKSNIREIAVREPQPIASAHPMTVVERAIEKGLTGDDLKQLMDLQERWEAGQARKAFDIAMADAQGEMPLLVKNRLVDFESAKAPNGRVTYKHEDLAEVVSKIQPVLRKHGLAHRFRTEHLEGGQIKVTCLITGHGHREETSLQSSRDNGPGRNDLQAIMSTVTYLERYTLKAALGLAAGHDDDGRGSEGTGETINAEQVKEIQAMIKDVSANEANVCKACHVENLADLTQVQFKKAKAKLETMRAPL